MAQFHSHLSDKSDQDASNTAIYLHIILQSLLTTLMIDPFLKTVWYHMNCYAKQYCCASDIYLLSYPVLEFSIVIDRVIGSHGYEKDVVVCL